MRVWLWEAIANAATHCVILSASWVSFCIIEAKGEAVVASRSGVADLIMDARTREKSPDRLLKAQRTAVAAFRALMRGWCRSQMAADL